MKRILFFVIAVLLSAPCFAQNDANEVKSESKTLEFISRGSSLIKKEFYDLGSVKGVECQVLIVTDLLKNEKMGCLRLETKYTSSYSTDTYVGTLDYDEIEDCIKSLNYIKDNILPSIPSTYTEVEYSTRDNIEVGAYYSEKKLAWIAYTYTKSYTSRSAEFFDAASLSLLVNKMAIAKNTIAEKIK